MKEDKTAPEGSIKEDKTAPEVALYLTFLAYKSGGLAAVRTALSALRYYAKLQGAEGTGQVTGRPGAGDGRQQECSL